MNLRLSHQFDSIQRNENTRERVLDLEKGGEEGEEEKENVPYEGWIRYTRRYNTTCLLPPTPTPKKHFLGILEYMYTSSQFALKI